MTGDPIIGDPVEAPLPPSPAPTPRRTGRVLLAIGLVAFVLGILATIYVAQPLIERWRGEPAAPAAQPLVQVQPNAAQPGAATAPITMEGLAAREAALDGQLRAIEARIAATDTASRAAAGYATRAEAMMIAFAARRALDRGLALGYIEGQLKARFGADEPNAVATVIAAANAPVTLEDLREALDATAPKLTSGSTRGGVWPAIKREMSDLIVLRRETTPSPRPADRLGRARRMLEAGQVEGALAEVVRMPGALDATPWIDAARRYIEARRALNALELSAINGRAQPGPGAPAPTPPPAAPVAATPPTPAN